MSNRVTLAQLEGMSAKDMFSIPVDHIEMLLEDVADLQKQAKSAAATMHSFMCARFGNDFVNARRDQKKDTGTINIVVDGRTIKSDLPKKVEWDQAKLEDAIDVIINDWNGKIDDYVDTKYIVSEAKWNAWPEPIKTLFRDARTVGVGKETFEIKPQKGA
jgi:hypothetical protein